MPSTDIPHDMWSTDDATRRCVQKLFEWSDDPKLRERRRHYQRALWYIASGLAEEEPFALSLAFTIINEQFASIGSLQGYQDNSKGVEVKPDDNAFDVVA